MKNIRNGKEPKGVNMLERFYPDRLEKSTYDIDFAKLFADGKRGILFDIDNTLVEHGEDSDPRSESLFKRLHSMGFKTCFISNNDEERVKRFNKRIGSDYVYKAGKPSRKGYLEGIRLMGVSTDEAVFIGDQLFTDIYGARRAGIDNICVAPISKKEAFQIVLKRKLEKIVMWSYRRHINKDKQTEEV